MNTINSLDEGVLLPPFLPGKRLSKPLDFDGRYYSRFFKPTSLGLIALGALSCLMSAGVGLGLMLVGFVVLAEF